MFEHIGTLRTCGFGIYKNSKPKGLKSKATQKNLKQNSVEEGSEGHCMSLQLLFNSQSLLLNRSEDLWKRSLICPLFGFLFAFLLHLLKAFKASRMIYFCFWPGFREILEDRFSFCSLVIALTSG